MSYFYVHVPNRIPMYHYEPIIEFPDDVVTSEITPKLYTLIRAERVERGFTQKYAGYLGDTFFRTYEEARKRVLVKTANLKKSLLAEVARVEKFRETMKKGGINATENKD